MEETASRYDGKLRIYCISYRGQPTTGGPPDWGLDVALTIPHRKTIMLRDVYTRSRTWTDSLDGRCK